MDVDRTITRDARGSVSRINDRRQDFVVVIPAHNEAPVINSTLKSLTTVTKDMAQIHVIADHCCDATAAIAARAGVHVHIRNNQGPAGKGPALHWWLSETHSQAPPEQIVFVMDADSHISPGCIENIQAHFVNGTCVAQTRIEPVISSTTPLELLSSLSEIVEHRIYDALRARLGWPVRLRGTGMIFRRKILEYYSEYLHTNVEDLELTVLIGEANVPITYLPNIVVLDPKPQDPRGAMHQRARWLRGQFQVVRDYSTHILRLILRGPKGWSLLASGLLKPRSFFIPLKILSVFFFLYMAVLASGWFWITLAVFGCASILIDLGMYLYGLRYTRFPWKTLLALAASPLFLFLWVQSTALAFIHRQPWLSSRRHIANPPRQRTTQVP